MTIFLGAARDSIHRNDPIGRWHDPASGELWRFGLFAISSTAEKSGFAPGTDSDTRVLGDDSWGGHFPSCSPVHVECERDDVARCSDCRMDVRSSCVCPLATRADNPKRFRRVPHVLFVRVKVRCEHLVHLPGGLDAGHSNTLWRAGIRARLELNLLRIENVLNCLIRASRSIVSWWTWQRD